MGARWYSYDFRALAPFSCKCVLRLSFSMPCFVTVLDGKLLVRISGLPRLLDVLATYTPTGQVAVTPAKFPDGLLEPAEAQDLLFGEVESVPDFSQAARACSAVSLPSDAASVF